LLQPTCIKSSKVDEISLIILGSLHMDRCISDAFMVSGLETIMYTAKLFGFD
jgi:hypothetical protein